MNAGRISASMMCADFADLRGSVRALERAGVELLHLDIMDGHFVPNLTFGPDFARALRAITDIPFDYHLMTEDPLFWLRAFPIRAGDYVSVHVETERHLQRALCTVRETGALAGAALNPATPPDTIRYVADDCDFVLLMTVNPGYAGQTMLPATMDKIARLRAEYPQMCIEVDGNVSFETAKTMRACGADLFVAGTSSVFHRGMTIPEASALLRTSIA